MYNVNWTKVATVIYFEEDGQNSVDNSISVLSFLSLEPLFLETQHTCNQSIYVIIVGSSK